MEYTIKELIKTFTKHHDYFLKQQSELDDKYPDRVKSLDDFSLCLALKAICQEIKTLQDKHEANKP